MNRYNNSSQPSSISDSAHSESEGEMSCSEDSDEEPEEDEEEDNLNTQALIDNVESSFLDLLVLTVDQVEKNQDTNHLLRIHTFTAPTKESRDEETQTDPHNNPAFAAAAEGDESDPPVDQEAIRLEIASLRAARESLVNQRKEVADRMKRANSSTSGGGSGGEHRAEDEKKIYEFEEAIEAIDSVIEFKNEVICGRECILSNCGAPGRNEADLVTRLTNLTTLDLQRLLWKYFSKVVEIRYSSKRLEKQVEELEGDCEKMEVMLNRNQKQIKEMQPEYEARIKMIIGLFSKNANTALEDYVHILDKKLTTAYKRQYDLQTALTELLVRHRYLTNGTDYDVKQIVKMLGIDTVQMGLNWRPEDRPSSKKKGEQHHHHQGLGALSPTVRSALEAGLDRQGLSRRMRETFDPRSASSQQRSRSHHHHHQPQQLHHHARDRDRDRDHLGPLDHHPDPQQHHFPTTQEVRRKGRQKLYIQPRSSSPHP